MLREKHFAGRTRRQIIAEFAGQTPEPGVIEIGRVRPYGHYSWTYPRGLRFWDRFGFRLGWRNLCDTVRRQWYLWRHEHD